MYTWKRIVWTCMLRTITWKLSYRKDDHKTNDEQYIAIKEEHPPLEREVEEASKKERTMK